MGVKPINSFQEFNQIINSEKPVVIDFWAEWCGPCKAISPIFEKLSEESKDVEFYKVDIDQQEQIAQEVGIRAIPNFILFKGGEKLESMTGAQPQGLQALVQKGASLI